jgi:hypothetical protein
MLTVSLNEVSADGQMSNLPQHVQFLVCTQIIKRRCAALMNQLAMSCQPKPSTHEIAHEYLHRQPPEIVDQDRLLFDEIMADPFEGDHWGQGYDSEVREGWTDSDSNSSGDDRDEHEKIVTPLRERVGVAHTQVQIDIEQEEEMRMRDAEERMRKLGEGYWVTGGKVVERAEVGEGWRAVSTGLSVASLAMAIDGDAKLGVKVSRQPPRVQGIVLDWADNRLFRVSSFRENCCLPFPVDLGLCSPFTRTECAS